MSNRWNELPPPDRNKFGAPGERPVLPPPSSLGHPQQLHEGSRPPSSQNYYLPSISQNGMHYPLPSIPDFLGDQYPMQRGQTQNAQGNQSTLAQHAPAQHSAALPVPAAQAHGQPQSQSGIVPQAHQAQSQPPTASHTSPVAQSSLPTLAAEAVKPQEAGQESTRVSHPPASPDRAAKTSISPAEESAPVPQPGPTQSLDIKSPQIPTQAQALGTNPVKEEGKDQRTPPQGQGQPHNLPLPSSHQPAPSSGFEPRDQVPQQSQGPPNTSTQGPGAPLSSGQDQGLPSQQPASGNHPSAEPQQFQQQQSQPASQTPPVPQPIQAPHGSQPQSQSQPPSQSQPQPQSQSQSESQSQSQPQPQPQPQPQMSQQQQQQQQQQQHPSGQTPQGQPDYYMYPYAQNMANMQHHQMPGYIPHADYRPLNVTDALSYLDQVKLQFRNQPDVYNHFLDIMKDFKSHSIDTPGVIDRVSSLFRGHTNLIQGFNTFLPAGYRIECSLDPMDPNPIRVTTPMGGVTRHEGDFERWAPQQVAVMGRPGRYDYNPGQAIPGQMLNPSGSAQSLAHPQPGSQGMSELHAAAVDQRRQGGPVEFNHAIFYVNKIKTRFSSQPEIYKAFLEILQAYQREQLRISEVYTQVTQLFWDAPDLLDDFKHFLPDTSPPKADAGVDQMRLPPVGNFGPPGMQQPNPAQPGLNTSPRNSRGPSGSRSRSASGVGAPPYAMQGVPVPGADAREDMLVPSAQELPSSSRKINLVEELSFFDKVKKVLSKQSYIEFLKVINLFTQRIIDLATLVERVDGFIGQYQDMSEWFKKFVGYEGKPLAIENISARKHIVDLSQCRSYGPSYCLLPKTEMYMPCSGRDEMCWEVLNDEWVGRPTWASEDSGFVAHRKNQYEEILYRIEEERHEYDHYIGANQRTIQVLETIANRIANMTTEEQAVFRLPVGLGHQSKIYQKVITKIYDKKSGAEVIEALHETPAVAVPIVLRRLKQKDEEWKRAQREWNKVWRETEQKVFYKSLDHIGLTFKQNDRKQLTSRALLSDIMTIKAEQSAKRKTVALPAPKSQMSFVVNDENVLVDLWKLILRFLEHGGNYSASDRETMSTFLRFFIPLFFGLKSDIVDKVYGSSPGSNALKRPRNDDAGFSSVFKRSKLSDPDSSENDDGKKEVTEETGTSEQNGTDEKDIESATAAAQQPWLKFDRVTPPLEEPPSVRHSYNLFANTSIYLFMRILQILYSRLEEIKQVEDIVSKDLATDRTTKFAKDLHLYDNKLEEMNLLFQPHDCYGQAVDICTRLIDGDIEPQWFEEALRQAYRNRAYKLYTIDKALYSLVKQLHSIVTDKSTGEILMLYERDRAAPESDIKSQIVYRMQVKQIIGPDELMFKLEWDAEKKVLSFQYLGTYDLTLKNVAQTQKQWEYYVTSYMMSVPTEGIPLDKIKAPLLYRTVGADVDKDFPFVVIEQDLQARVCMTTYKLFFEAGSADYVMRPSPDWYENRQIAQDARKKRWATIQESFNNSAEDSTAFANWLEKGIEEPTTKEESAAVPPVSDERGGPSGAIYESGLPVPNGKHQAEADQVSFREKQNSEAPEAIGRPETENPSSVADTTGGVDMMDVDQTEAVPSA